MSSAFQRSSSKTADQNTKQNTAKQPVNQIVKPHSQTAKSHWAVLGAARFFLATVVVCTHIPWFVPPSDSLAFMVKFSGLSAVFAFLLISGYSIASSIDRQPQEFYRRRLIRILPLYLLAVLFGYSLKFLIGGPYAPALSWTFHYPDLGTVIGNLMLLQGFIFDPIRTNVVVWTLSVEVFFYVLAPALNRLPNKQIILPISYISIALFCTYKLISSVVKLPYYSDLRLGSAAFLLAWAWLLGFWFFFNRKQKRFGAGVLIGFGLLAAMVQTSEDFQREPFFALTYIITCLLLVYGDRITLPQSVNRAFLYLGDISYPLYLFHFPILLFTFNYFGLESGIAFFGIAFGVSALLDRYFDKPIRTFFSNQLKRQTASKRSSLPLQTAAQPAAQSGSKSGSKSGVRTSTQSVRPAPRSSMQHSTRPATRRG